MKKIKTKKFVFVIFLVLLICLQLVSANYEPYESFEVKKIVSYSNSFDKSIKKYSIKFKPNVPEKTLKSIFGVFTQGNLENVKEYDQNGRIGPMGLIPFVKKPIGSYHHNRCLESDCMTIKVADNLPVEEKREKVKQEYLNTDNSLCCAAYILSQTREKDSSSVTYPKLGSPCLSQREQVTYKKDDKWSATVRQYVSKSCVNLYFVEKYNQLYDALDEIKFNSYGVLKFTPFFSIKAPELIDTYSDIRNLVSNVIGDCNSNTENCVMDKMSDFLDDHENMSFSYCEEPKMNILNYIYDRLVNSQLGEEDNCKYLIGNQSLTLPASNETFINISSFPSIEEINISNNYKRYSFNSDDPRFDGDRYIKVEESSGSLKYMFKDCNNPGNYEGNFKKFYLIKNSSLGSDDFLFAFEDQQGDYYNMLHQKINLTKMNISAYPICQKKYKYFTCLDTNLTEKVFNWSSWQWQNSSDTIKIKFAFQIPK